MKVTVLVPSEEYKSYAGARIRYARLRPELQRLGISLELADIGTFALESGDSDALLISKCHDAKSLVAAAGARERGRLVGADLFDDYFSQDADSRLIRYRNWLSQLLDNCHFALCSTPAMAAVARRYNGDLPVHVVNDPAPDVGANSLADLVATKLATAQHARTVRLAWFGIGDNPHFKVGLIDLAAYAGVLKAFGNGGVDVELAVLTNARALTADGLALIEQLPVRTTIEEWSEERERGLLGEAFACFLPVNAQSFSAAKSLNRAITALSAGCQVISVGYPLYEPLGDLIYRDPGALLSDLARGSMKFSPLTVASYQAAMEAIASASGEAARLREFLGRLETPEREEGQLVLVHGQSTSGAAHKAVQALAGLSVASPYCTGQVGFDVLFRGAGGGLAMFVSDRAAKRLSPDVRDRLLQPVQNLGEKKFRLLPEGDEEKAALTKSEDWQSAPLPYQLASYRSTLARMCARLEATFGPCRVVISENSPLPFNFRN